MIKLFQTSERLGASRGTAQVGAWLPHHPHLPPPASIPQPGHTTIQPKPHRDSHHRGLEAHDLKNHQQKYSSPHLELWQCQKGFAGLLRSPVVEWTKQLISKWIIFSPFQAGQAVFGTLTGRKIAAFHTLLSSG